MATHVEHPNVPNWGIDLSPRNRPGVPYELPPRPIGHAHWARPEQQPATVEELVSVDVGHLTPVFGTAMPPSGLSGRLRRMAYRIHEDRASHWALLLLADRVDGIGSDIGGFVMRNLRLVLGVAAAAAILRAIRRSKR
jgi:hypothetical protein